MLEVKFLRTLPQIPKNWETFPQEFLKMFTPGHRTEEETIAGQHDNLGHRLPQEAGGDKEDRPV